MSKFPLINDSSCDAVHSIFLIDFCLMPPPDFILYFSIKKIFLLSEEELQSVIFLANIYLMPPKIYGAGESTVCGITTALFANKIIQVEKYAFCMFTKCKPRT